jgi:outer membrane protein assembly factor BamA
MRHTLPLRCLLVCLLGITSLQAQVIAEIIYDGLPMMVSSDSITALLRMPPSSDYDKALLAGDRDRVNSALVDLGYLDVETRTKVGFIPSGVKLTYTIKARNCYTISSVEVVGVAAEEVSALLKELAITPETPCVASIHERLAKSFSDKMNIHYLFVIATAKPNSDKQTATVVLSK